MKMSEHTMKHDPVQNFILLFTSILIVLVFKNGNIWNGIYMENFLTKREKLSVTSLNLS